MSDRRVVLVGATGLIGRAVIRQAVGLDGIRLAAIARRRIPLPMGARMEMFVADTGHWAETIEALRPHVVVCALGTTWQKAGKDEDAFRAVDEALVLEVARAAKAAGVRHFIVVSSAGADRSSRHLYLQVKAEVEEALARLRFERLDILRPGLLRGRREDDPRPAERLAILASPLLDLFLHGKYREYRSIGAAQLADVILLLCREKPGGRFLHDHDSLHRLLRRASVPQ